jgi:hypothetical protein
MKHIRLFEQFVNEALKAKKPNDVIEVDIDFAGSDSDLRKLSKKHKLEADEYEPGMVILKGKKKDILDYLQSDEYAMDAEDIEGLFPELLESDIISVKMKRTQLNEAVDIDGFISALELEIQNAGGHFYIDEESDDYVFAVSKNSLSPNQVTDMFDSGKPVSGAQMIYIDSGKNINLQTKGIESALKKSGVNVSIKPLINTYL